ncbi:MAG: magnesium transporter [Rhizobiales bacterium 65-9]|nr:MgtC/SapB family protein [Hyphomicrobiales bacterium]OJY37416.1 MAG: magnesium transporter [Rhizobiales bacterium 65-9]
MISDSELDAILRLAAAAAVGMAIGVNRDMWGKPTGIRTLGLVALGAALTALATVSHPLIAGHPDALSRVIQGVIQGVLAGIGFIGAGVVMRDPKALEVHGLTTAATVWVTAALGIACALASWHLVIAGLAIALTLLVIVRPLEAIIDKKRSQTTRQWRE